MTVQSMRGQPWFSLASVQLDAVVRWWVMKAFWRPFGTTMLQKVTRETLTLEIKREITGNHSNRNATLFNAGHAIANGITWTIPVIHGPLGTRRRRMTTVVASRSKPKCVQLSNNLSALKFLPRRNSRQGRESSGWVCQHVFELARQRTRFGVASAVENNQIRLVSAVNVVGTTPKDFEEMKNQSQTWWTINFCRLFEG